MRGAVGSRRRRTSGRVDGGGARPARLRLRCALCTLCIVLGGLALGRPGPAQGQEQIGADTLSVAPLSTAGPRLRLDPVAPRTLGGRCGAGLPDEPIVAQVSAILSNPEAPGVQDRLVGLHDSLAAEVKRRPEDPAVHYGLALVLGARSEVSGGRDKLNHADAMQARARAVLELDPEHSGARHLLGRVHAAVQRMSGLKRILARTLFGGRVLEAASWESARAHLEAAEAGAPCIADHHFELARLYADLGDPGAAMREIRHVLQLTAGEEGTGGAGAKARRLARELGGLPSEAAGSGGTR